MSGNANFRLSKASGTSIQVVAGATDAAAVLNVQGLWRLNEATVTRAHPGGGAGTYLVFATAAAQNITNSPAPFTDHSVYTWDLQILPSGTPTIVAGVVDVFRLIGHVAWNGSAITGLSQLANSVTGALLDDAAFTAGQVTATRQSDGSFKLDVTDSSIVDADVSSGAAIAPSKIAGTAVITTDSRLSDTRTPTDNTVTSAKIVDGTIVDADISGAAGIVATKLAAAAQQSLWAPGDMKFSAVPAAPAGWALADGSSQLRAGTFAALFAVVGTTYGSVDGTHFNLPDMQGRVPVGVDGAAGRLSANDALGQSGGEEKHTLAFNELPAFGSGVILSGAGAGANITLGGGGYGIANPTGQPHNNMPPYLVGNWFIKL